MQPLSAGEAGQLHNHAGRSVSGKGRPADFGRGDGASTFRVTALCRGVSDLAVLETGNQFLNDREVERLLDLVLAGLEALLLQAYLEPLMRAWLGG